MIAARSFGLIVAYQGADVLVRGVIGGPAGSVSLAIEGCATVVAVYIHLKDRRVMDEPIDGGERHGGVGKDLAPFAEELIRRDQQGAALIAGSDQLEQH